MKIIIKRQRFSKPLAFIVEKRLFILILTSISILANAQENGLQTKLIDPSITNDKFSNEQFDSIYLNLQPLKFTRYKDHIRISQVGQTVDFFRSGTESYQGVLTNFTTEYKYVKGKNGGDRKSYQYLFEKINLDQTTVNKMVQQLIKTGQPEVPTGALISSWEYFLDCNSILFEFNLHGKYCHQSFHCLLSQSDTVQFKKVVVDNYQLLTSSFQLDSLYKNFESKLLKGKTYSADGFRMMYKWTDEQTAAWKKDETRRAYLKSIKDSVDTYLSVELKKSNLPVGKMDCYDDYQLFFSKNGKLKKVKVRASARPELSDGLFYYLADNFEITTCKRAVKKMFKKINLRSFNLKYKVYRELSIYNGEAHIMDNNIY